MKKKAGKISVPCELCGEANHRLDGTGIRIDTLTPEDRMQIRRGKTKLAPRPALTVVHPTCAVWFYHNMKATRFCTQRAAEKMILGNLGFMGRKVAQNEMLKEIEKRRKKS